MPQTRRRVVSILCLLAFLALPLMAQPNRDTDLSVLRLISAVWERLTGTATTADTGTTSAWDADGTSEPVPTPTPGPVETGRGGWDPNG